MAVQTEVPGILWPPIPDRRSAALMAMLFQLDRSQWLTPEELLTAQFQQLDLLVRHAIETVPFYRDRMGCVPDVCDPTVLRQSWSSIPILTRSEVQAAGATLHSRRIPSRHGSVHSLLTSGSTGQPLHCQGTQITQFFWRCMTLRDHQWHRRDFSKTLAAIRFTDQSAAPPEGKTRHDWGPPVNLIRDSGRSAILTTDSTVSQQATWLCQVCPSYLIVYPSNVKALAKWFLEQDRKLPGLIHVRSFGEILEAETRALCQRAWGVPVIDCYSSQEVGYVALECPDAAQNYHVQSESLFVEILDDEGNPCVPGQVGRVVATPLHNAAMPLIRYDLGDYAEVGSPCACGRGLPALKRIVGRQRNMITLPDGQRRWPGLGRGEVLASLPPIQQYQIVQVAIDKIDIRLVQPTHFSDSEEEQIRDHFCKTFGYPFDIQIHYVEKIERSRNGKFEEFISLL